MIQNTVTYGRICYMIAETCKSKNDKEQAFKYYLKGIESEPTFNENYVDLSMVCRDFGEVEISNVIIIFGKAVQQIKQMGRILDFDDDEFNLDELIFEEVVSEERSVVLRDNGNYDQFMDDPIQEIKLKDDLHSLLISGVCELKERIQNN